MTEKQIIKEMCSRPRLYRMDKEHKDKLRDGISLILRRKRDRATVSHHPITPTMGLAIFSGIAIIGVSIGASIGTYVFFGTATLVGLVALIESNKYLKMAAHRSTSFIDIVIFTATVYATAQLGVTVSAALVFAGLGYTLVYSPYLRAQKVEKPS